MTAPRQADCRLVAAARPERAACVRGRGATGTGISSARVQCQFRAATEAPVFLGAGLDVGRLAPRWRGGGGNAASRTRVSAAAWRPLRCCARSGWPRARGWRGSQPRAPHSCRGSRRRRDRRCRRSRGCHRRCRHHHRRVSPRRRRQGWPGPPRTGAGSAPHRVSSWPHSVCRLCPLRYTRHRHGAIQGVRRFIKGGLRGGQAS